jgi:hypothetical protein
MRQTLKIKRNYFAGASVAGFLLLALVVGAWFGAGRSQNAHAADITTPEQSGMTFMVSPDKLTGSTAMSASSFAITLTDTNAISTDANQPTEYSFSGLPKGATAKVGGVSLPQVGVDLNGGPIFAASAAQLGITTTAGGGNSVGAPVTIVLPTGWVGDIADLMISRNDLGNNIVTDFDNGTFDYIGTASPQLPNGVSNYTYVSNVGGRPGDGYYSIGMSGAWSSTSWRDVRSHTNPWTEPYIGTDGAAVMTAAQNTAENQAASGKFLIINATMSIPAPNTFISFTINVEPYTTYDVSAFVTSVLIKGYTGAAGFGNITMVATLADGTDIIIGDSGSLTTTLETTDPATMSDWRNFNKLISTANNTSVTISFRNNAPGGSGNDIGIDDISVRPMPKASFAAGQEIEVFPTAANDSANTDYRTSKSIDLFANDAVPDGAQISVTTTGATHGTVAIGVDGNVTYTPEKGFDGVATFSYNVLDSGGNILKDINGANLTKTVTVNVAPPKILAKDDVATTMNGIPVNIDILANDTVYDRATTQISVANSAPAHGSVAVVDGKIVYTPDEDYFGADEFIYEITDENGQKTTAKVVVNITDDNISANDFSYDSNLGEIDEDSAKDLAQLFAKDQTGENIRENATVDETQLAKINEAIEKGAGGSFELTFTNPDENDGNGPAMITINVTLLPRDYDVTFIDPDGNVIREETVEYGDPASAPKPPARNGEKFIGWDKTFDKITGNLIVTAIYEKLPTEPVVPGAPNTGLMSL